MANCKNENNLFWNQNCLVHTQQAPDPISVVGTQHSPQTKGTPTACKAPAATPPPHGGQPPPAHPQPPWEAAVPRCPAPALVPTNITHLGTCLIYCQPPSLLHCPHHSPQSHSTGKRILTIDKSWCLISTEPWDVCPNFAVRNSTHPLNKSCYETVFIVHTVLPRCDWPSKFTLLCKVLTGGSSTCHRMLPWVWRWAGRERRLVGPKRWIHIYFSKWPQLDKLVIQKRCKDLALGFSNAAQTHEVQKHLYLPIISTFLQMGTAHIIVTVKWQYFVTTQGYQFLRTYVYFICRKNKYSQLIILTGKCRLFIHS